MVRIGLLDGHDDRLGRWVRQIDVAFGAGVFCDHGVSGEVSVVDEELTVPCVIGVKNQGEQSLFVCGVSDPVRDIEERGRPQIVTVDDPYPSWLLDNEQSPASVAGGSHRDRPLQSGDDELERDGYLARIKGRRRCRRRLSKTAAKRPGCGEVCRQDRCKEDCRDLLRGAPGGRTLRGRFKIPMEDRSKFNVQSN